MTELTAESLEAAILEITAQTRDMGERLSVRPTTLYVHPSMQRAAARILGWLTGKHTQHGPMRKRKKMRMAGIKPYRTEAHPEWVCGTNRSAH